MQNALRLAAWCSLGFVAVMSLLPGNEMVRTNLGGHTEHAIAYAGTALLFRLGYPAQKTATVAAAFVVVAALLETLQHLVPGRHPAVEDWAASVTGALLGVLAGIVVARSVRHQLWSVAKGDLV